MKKYTRMDRLNKLSKSVLGEIIEELYPYEEYGMITVTEVDLSKDLRHAKVYISIFLEDTHKKSEDDVVEKLKKDEYRIKKGLVDRIRMKYTPELRFIPDETQKQADEIYRLLENDKETGDERPYSSDT